MFMFDALRQRVRPQTSKDTIEVFSRIPTGWEHQHPLTSENLRLSDYVFWLACVTLVIWLVALAHVSGIA